MLINSVRVRDSVSYKLPLYYDMYVYIELSVSMSYVYSRLHVQGGPKTGYPVLFLG